MPRRSGVLTLPREVRERLDALLIERGFGGYSELADWLAEQGHPLSRSAIHRYGSEFERRIEQIHAATVQAEALIKAAPDDTMALSDASIRLVQQRVFELLVDADEGDIDAMAKAARALIEAARAGTTVRQERRRALAEAADAAETTGRKAGLSKETIAELRRAIEGDGP